MKITNNTTFLAVIAYYYNMLENIFVMIFSIRLKTINLDISITIILTDKKRVLHVE